MNEKQASMTHFLECWPGAEYRRDRKVRGRCTCATEMLRGNISVLRGPRGHEKWAQCTTWALRGFLCSVAGGGRNRNSGSEWNTGALTGHFSVGWLEEEFRGVWGGVGEKAVAPQSAGLHFPRSCCYSAFVSTLEPGFLSNRKHLATANSYNFWTNCLEWMFPEKGQYEVKTQGPWYKMKENGGVIKTREDQRQTLNYASLIQRKSYLLTKVTERIAGY